MLQMIIQTSPLQIRAVPVCLSQQVCNPIFNSTPFSQKLPAFLFAILTSLKASSLLCYLRTDVNFFPQKLEGRAVILKLVAVSKLITSLHPDLSSSSPSSSSLPTAFSTPFPWVLPLHLCQWLSLPVLYPSTVSFSLQFLPDLRTIFPPTPNGFLWWCTKQVNLYCRLKSGMCDGCLQVITLEYKIQFVLEGDKESQWRWWNYFLGWTWRILYKSFCLNIAEVFSQGALELEMLMVSLWTHSRCFAECISTLELLRT